MNFIALKVKIGDDWEYLDLSNEPSFKKSNGLYLFSEAEFSRSTSIKLPSTEHNLTILNNPNLPVLRGNTMILKLDARLTVEAGEIYGKLAINKYSDHNLECVFIFEVCDILDFINSKNLNEVGVDLDQDYSILWSINNIKEANDASLRNDKIAIIPYLNDCNLNYPTSLQFYKLALYYPSLSVTKLIYDILNGVKNNINSSVDLSHLYDDLTESNKYDIWMITDKLTKRENNTINFEKNQYINITSGTGDFGTLTISEGPGTMTTDTYWSLWNGWSFHSIDTNTWVPNLKQFSITFGAIPAHTIVMAFKSNVGGSQYWNLKTGERILGANQLTTIEPGETINIDLDAAGITNLFRGGFAFYDKNHWALDDSSWYNGHFYFTQEYNNGTYSIPATLSTVPANPEEEYDMIPFDTWIFSNNAPDMTVMDLIKSFAYITGTQFIYDTTNSSDLSSGALKFVKSKTLSTYDINNVSKIESLEKKVGDFNKKEVIKFQDRNYITDIGSTSDILTYEIDNECMDSSVNEHMIAGDEGGSTTYNDNRWYSPTTGHDIIIIGNKTNWLYRKDVTIEENEDSNGNQTFNVSYESEGPTFARAFTFYSYTGALKYRCLNRLDQRASGAIPTDNFYSDIFNNSTKYIVNFPMSVQDYFSIKWSTDFYIEGVRYAWLDITWDNGIAKITLQKYTDYLSKYILISTDSDPSTGGVTSGGGYYAVGDICTISQVPNPGCTFTKWTVEGEPVTTNSSFTFNVIEGDDGKLFIAHYEIPLFTITTTASPSEAGTTSGDGTYGGGDSCVISATANPGYTFAEWFENNSSISTNPNYAFVVDGNRSFVARFEKNEPVSLKVNANIESVTLSGQGYYPKGSMVTVSATPDQREYTYVFDHWQPDVSSVQSSTNNPYTFQILEGMVITAIFTTNYQVDTYVKDDVGGTVRGSGLYSERDSCTLIAIPDPGYEFDHWEDLDTAAEIGTSNILILNGQNGNRRILAVFIPSSKLTITILTDNSGSATGGGEYNLNDTCTLTATPSTGYNFYAWYEEDVLLSTNNPYSFTVTESKTIKLVCYSIKFNISATSNPLNCAYISGLGTSYYYNDTCTLTATPYSSNYIFTNWTENGNIVSTSNPYSFTVNDNRTLVANFVENTNTYTITASGTNGTVTGDGEFDYGDICTLEATPDANYMFSGWYENGTLITTHNPFSFAVINDRTITASFTLAEYSITATGNDCTITGTGTYTYGATCTLTVTPDTGYIFSGWYENGVLISSDNPYSFTVTGDRTLECKCLPDNIFTITLVNNIENGNTVQFGATPLSTITITFPEKEGRVNFN